MALVDLPSVPSFFDDMPLSASDLNKVSAAQLYLHNVVDGYNPLFYVRTLDSLSAVVWQPYYYHVFHRHNFLRWVCQTSISGTLRFVKVDGTASTISVPVAATSGTVDITSLGITLNTPYRVCFDTGSGESSPPAIREINEVPNSGNVITYPEAYPAIVSPSTVAQVNGIGANTRYLMGMYKNSIPGYYQFEIASHPGANTRHIYYRGYHRLRYLFLRATMQHDSAYGGSDGEFHIRVNGTSVYSDVVSDETVNYQITIDLDNNTGHVIHLGPVHTIDVPVPNRPAQGSYYEISVLFDELSSMKLDILAEVNHTRNI